jgi:hypothetical protein
MLREMILVKFWFWSFWFFWTQRDYVAGRFGAMRFPQNRQRAFNRRTQRQQSFFPLFPPLTPVQIGIEPGRTSLRLEATARQGPALQNIEHSILNIQQWRQAGSAVLRLLCPFAPQS